MNHFLELVRKSILRGVTVTDKEFDDVVFLRFAAHGIPLLAQCITDDSDWLTKKDKMQTAFVTRQCAAQIQYMEYGHEAKRDDDDDANHEDMLPVLAAIRSITSDVLYVNILGPCARLLRAIQNHPVLSVLPKVFVICSSAYNLRHSGILCDLAEDKKNTILDFSRTMLLGTHPPFRTLSALLGGIHSQDWTTVRQTRPDCFHAFVSYQTAANKRLLSPDYNGLFDYEQVQGLTAQEKIVFHQHVAELVPLFTQDNQAETFVRNVEERFKEGTPFFRVVRTDRWDLVRNIPVAAPIDDMLIPLMFYLQAHDVSLRVYRGEWCLHQEEWFSMITACDFQTGNAFQISACEDSQALYALVKQFLFTVFDQQPFVMIL
jgi:hypothetical protein